MQNRRQVYSPCHNLASTLYKIIESYKSVKIDAIFVNMPREDREISKAAYQEADQDLSVQRKLCTCKRGVKKLRNFFSML